MLKKNSLLTVLTATTLFVAGAAYAADQAQQAPSSSQTALDKDAGKLSRDGTRAYGDIALTRLAIFDGRVKDAAKFIKEADADFTKAKTDETVFTKAEAEFKTPDMKTTDDKTAASSDAKTDSSDAKTASATQGETQKSADASTPKAWLPVDGEMMVNEDYSANPTKAAAVADANKTLAAGDKKGAMEKLKLADVNIDFVMAVVPVDQTIKDVHQADMMVTNGKYYEASQLLRQVQDSTRYDMLDVNGVPTKAGATAATSASEAKTH